MATSQQPAPPPPPSPPPVRMASSASQFGAPTTHFQWSGSQVAMASPAALSKALSEGRLDTYLNS